MKKKKGRGKSAPKIVPDPGLPDPPNSPSNEPPVSSEAPVIGACGTMASYIDFLDSDVVALGTAESTRSFKIHKSLLGTKCKPLFSAFENTFKESNQGLYVCQDTSERTLARFIEWAYRGDYPEGPYAGTNVQDYQSGRRQTGSSKTTETSKTEIGVVKLHLEVYIFAEIYRIEDLKTLSYGKLTTSFIAMVKPNDQQKKQVVIEMLHLAFTKLPRTDDLTHWLGQYAAWCIEEIRWEASFQKLLETVPSLVSQMFLTLQAAPYSPWSKRLPETPVPPAYVNDYYDDYDDNHYDDTYNDPYDS